MPTGFQSIGETGSYQIDNSFVNLALDRSGTLTSQQYTAGETTNTSPTRVELTLNEGEILAISCVSYCALGSKVGNTAYVYVDAPAGRAVEYYIFKPGTTLSNYGLQVFADNGVVTFDSGWKLFDVRQIMSGTGTLNMPVGRKYAIVHTQIATSIFYAKVVVGMAPNFTVNYIRSTSFSSYRINSGTIECAISAVDLAGTRPVRTGATNSYQNTYQNGVTPQALVLDVTGYL